VVLDKAMYASRLLDWLYDEQASQVRQRQANDEAIREYLREEHPRASEHATQELFGMWYGPDVAGETEASQRYVEVRAFLEPLGVQSRASYHIVNYAAERDWLIASDNEPLGRDWGGTLLATTLDDGVPRFAVYYDRVLITEVGMRVVEASRVGWSDIMPRRGWRREASA
jgi:hypothetical protein